MNTLIELPANLNIQFVPMYCKPTVKYIQDFHVTKINEPRIIMPEFLKEIIINYVVQDIENFDFGNIIIAPKGSGYLYLNYGNSVFNSDAGTYFFPKDTAMPLFDLVLKQLNEYMSCKIQENKWERVTIHRRV